MFTVNTENKYNLNEASNSYNVGLVQTKLGFRQILACIKHHQSLSVGNHIELFFFKSEKKLTLNYSIVVDYLETLNE